MGSLIAQLSYVVTWCDLYVRNTSKLIFNKYWPLFSSDTSLHYEGTSGLWNV